MQQQTIKLNLIYSMCMFCITCTSLSVYMQLTLEHSHCLLIRHRLLISYLYYVNFVKGKSQLIHDCCVNTHHSMIHHSSQWLEIMCLNGLLIGYYYYSSIIKVLYRDISNMIQCNLKYNNPLTKTFPVARYYTILLKDWLDLLQSQKLFVLVTNGSLTFFPFTSSSSLKQPFK